MTSELIKHLTKYYFSNFIYKCFSTINPGIVYKHNWHIDLIANNLEKARNGKIQRLMINMPPRALKSICVSVAWPAWLLGHNPKCRVIVASYSQVLSNKLSIDCKNIMQSEWYRELFPDTIISKGNNTKSKFVTTEHGFRFATSIGGSLIGEGGDYLIIDDPHHPNQVNSARQRQKVLEWYEQSFATRLNDKNKGAIILVMQRLHEGDLSGYLLTKSKIWHQLKIPAIIKEDKKLILGENEFIQEYFIQEGNPLQPDREDLSRLMQIQEELGTYNFAAQYMQEPISASSSLLNKENICFYTKLENFEYIVQSWDTAIKVSSHADYSVCTTWAVQQNKYYLIDMVRQKYEYSELKKAAIEQASKYNPSFIIIEDKASGQSLIQDLVIETNFNISKYKPTTDKITRFAASVPFFESGRINLPEKAPWLNIFLQEIMAFPNGNNDDIVDSLSQFIEVIKRHRHMLPRIRSF
jgi:predicted phage terminase large subunit-like protein